jgi:hypothetical protein
MCRAEGRALGRRSCPLCHAWPRTEAPVVLPTGGIDSRRVETLFLTDLKPAPVLRD